MARIFVTGSTEGLGRAAAQTLIDAGHEVVLHARNAERAAQLSDLTSRSIGVVTADLASAADVRQAAERLNAIGRMDAVIHNAGVYSEAVRGATPEGHARLLAVNTLAPFMLTALMEPPRRLIYLSSGLHRGGGDGDLRDIDWTERRWDTARAYAESKLFVTALALAVARRWPEVLSNAVDPGWVRTRMGGSSAPTDITTGQRTQTWLAVSDAPSALTSGGYWHDMRQEKPAEAAVDAAIQDQLISRLEQLTGVTLP